VSGAATGLDRAGRAVLAAPLRIGVIGAGRIGGLHAELLGGEVDGIRLAGVCDPVAERAAALAERLAAPQASDAVELIFDPGVDAVAICSSTDTHAALIEAAAAAGKPIFCEKPVALTLPLLDRLNAVVEAAGVVFQVGFNRRFDPSHASVRDAVVEGAVGDPHLLRITSRDPEPPPPEYIRVSGGLFLDMTVHDFDLARFVVGSEVTEVFARGLARIDPALANLGDVDTALISLMHEDGCLTAIDNSRRARYGYDQRVEVFGSSGMARSENQPLHSGMVFTEAGEGAPALKPFFLDRYRESYRRAWAAFAAAVAGGGPAPVGGEDARRALLIGLAAKRSLAERRSVSVAEVER
jgi:myo-inositol 2-dehydrogenase / D-chiro-inositol 1-dehydrogenase